MPFNQKPQKFNAKINPVTIGSGDKTVTIGGDSTFPFYTFDAPSENCAKIGVEISDMGLEGMSEGIKAYYDGATTMGEIAKKAAAMEGADFVALLWPSFLCILDSPAAAWITPRIQGDLQQAFCWRFFVITGGKRSEIQCLYPVRFEPSDCLRAPQ